MGQEACYSPHLSTSLAQHEQLGHNQAHLENIVAENSYVLYDINPPDHEKMSRIIY